MASVWRAVDLACAGCCANEDGLAELAEPDGVLCQTSYADGQGIDPPPPERAVRESSNNGSNSSNHRQDHASSGSDHSPSSSAHGIVVLETNEEAEVDVEIIELDDHVTIPDQRAGDRQSAVTAQDFAIMSWSPRRSAQSLAEAGGGRRPSVVRALLKARNSTQESFHSADSHSLTHEGWQGRYGGMPYHADLIAKAVVTGSQILLVGVILSIVGRGLWLASRVGTDCDIWPRTLSSDIRWLVTGLEAFFSFGAVVLLLWTYCRPRTLIYYTALVLLLSYGFMLLIPPLGLSCRDLIRNAKCEGHELVHLDCSLQGSPHMTSSMMVIFVGPFIFPHIRMMVLLSFVHLCLYVGYTTWQQNDEEGFFNTVDAVIGFVLLLSTSFFSVLVKQRIDRRKQETYDLTLKNKEAFKTMVSLFKYLVPEHVVRPMLDGKEVSRMVKEASVLFIQICNFGRHMEILAPQGPAGVLNFLNVIFSGFDAIMKRYGVMKVETIGEEYVAVVGVSPEDRRKRNHSVVLLDLIRAATHIMSNYNQEITGDASPDTLALRMGLHTGKVVAGVIGNKLPRFRLFGDTMNMAARMMHHGLDGELQFSDATEAIVNLLPLEMEEQVKRECRGKIDIKGKGLVTTYLLDWREHANEYRKVELDNTFIHMPSLDRDVSGRTTWSPTFARSTGSNFSQRVRLWSSSITGTQSMHTSSQLSSAPNPPTSRWKRSGSIELKEVMYSTVPEVKKQRHWRMWFSPREQWAAWRNTAVMKRSLAEEWRQAHFKAKILEPARRRSHWQAAVVLVISILEAVVAIALESDTESDAWLQFCGARAVIILLFGVAFGVSRTPAISSRMHLFCAVRLMLMSGMLIALLISYRALAMDFDSLDLKQSPSELEKRMDERPYRIQVWNYMFVLMYLTGSVALRLPMLHTVLLVIMASSTLLVNAIAFHEGLVVYNYHQLVMFLIVNLVYITYVRAAERRSMIDFQADKALKEANSKIINLLHTLLPPLVATELLRSDSQSYVPPSHRYEDAVLVQSDIVGFTEMASFRQPQEVVHFVSTLFGEFDRLTDKHQVCKIETVGDAYIAGQAESPLSIQNRPTSMLRFALEMVQVTLDWARRIEERINLRVGLHHGRCLGGIVGNDMLRYHLFGDMLKELGNLESTAPNGRVHVSRAFRNALARELTEILPGGEPSPVDHLRLSVEDLLEEYQGQDGRLLTSKGRVVAAQDVGGQPTYLARLRD